MDTDQAKGAKGAINGTAEEGLKKHGDQLEKQVKDAAKQSQDKDDDKAKDALTPRNP